MKRLFLAVQRRLRLDRGTLGCGTVLTAAVVLGGCDVPTDLPRFESTFVVPTEALAMPVIGGPASVVSTHDLGETRKLANRARGGAIVIDVVNESGATGSIELAISNASVSVRGSVDARGASRQRIPLTAAEVQSLLGAMVTLRASGTLCRSSGCTPGATGSVVRLLPRIELVLELGTEG